MKQDRNWSPARIRQAGPDDASAWGGGPPHSLAVIVASTETGAPGALLN